MTNYTKLRRLALLAFLGCGAVWFGIEAWNRVVNAAPVNRQVQRYQLVVAERTQYDILNVPSRPTGSAESFYILDTTTGETYEWWNGKLKRLSPAILP